MAIVTAPKWGVLLLSVHNLVETGIKTTCVGYHNEYGMIELHARAKTDSFALLKGLS
jgi:hypothetical protein